MGAPPPSATAPPALADLLQQATQASIGTLPGILQAFQQFGPQFARAETGIRDILFPLIQRTRGGLASLLGERLGQTAAGEIPEFLRGAFQRSVREGQAARGIALSPIGVREEGLTLAQLSENIARFNIGASQEFAATPAPSIAGTSAATSLLRPPGIEFGAELERGLIGDRDAAALQNFRAAQARRQRIARIIGTGVGLAVTPFNPAVGGAIVSGFQGGQQSGTSGTFF